METPTDLDGLIQNTSREFAAFFEISSEPHTESIEDNIEGVLSRLDELYGMLDMIRSDNNVVIGEILPLIEENLTRLQPVFERIDRLEEFTQVVKGNIIAIEKELKLAEKDFGALSSIRKAVSGLPLFSFKKKNSSRKEIPRNPPYVAPKIFSTSSWIEKDESLESSPDTVNLDLKPTETVQDPDLKSVKTVQNTVEIDLKSTENCPKSDPVSEAGKALINEAVDETLKKEEEEN